MRISQFSILFLVAEIAIVATGTLAQAQQNVPQRQTFPWSSSVRTGRSIAGQSAQPTARPSAAQPIHNAARTVTQSASRVAERLASQIQHARHKVVDRVSEVKNPISTNEVVYLDRHGNEISYEKFQAQLTNVEHTVSNSQPSHNHPVPNHRGYPTVDTNAFHGTANETVWRKTQNAVLNVTSLFKKPSLFKPAGFTLPSQKTVWGKPRFNAPSTWFSRTAADPITFAQVGTLPRHGQVPSSIASSALSNNPTAQPLVKHTLPTKQTATAFAKNATQTANRFTDGTISNTTQRAVGAVQSVWDATADRTASIIDRNSDFAPVR